MPKYVASRSLADVGGEAILLGPDVVDAIERLKAEPGKDLMKYGTSGLDGTLLTAGLVDEISLWFVPGIVGKGRRLFEGVDIHSVVFELTDVRRFESGSVLHTYVPDQKGGGAGIAKTASASAMSGAPTTTRPRALDFGPAPDLYWKRRRTVRRFARWRTG